MSVPTLHLDKIQDVAQVSEGKAKKLMEACVWCMLASDHRNGVKIEVNHETATTKYPVSWPSKIDIEAIKRSYNQDDAVEEGAEAIALLVSVTKTDFTAVERASTTTGIDYWLGYKDGGPNNPFKRAGRLEVSGLLKENDKNTVKARIQTKLRQTLPTDRTFKVYVVIVEFGKPYAAVVLKK